MAQVVTHGLQREPLLSLASIAQLAARLDENSFDIYPASRPELQLARDAGRFHGSIPEAVSALADRQLWINIHDIGRIQEYETLIHQCLDPIMSASWPDAHSPAGFLFLAGGQTRTVPHLDNEPNFLLQIAGTKICYTARCNTTTTQTALERISAGDIGAVDGMPSDAQCHVLSPGLGLYIPPGVAHAVDYPGPLSVSLSVIFRTRSLDRQGRVHTANRWLRRLGISPLPPGRHQLRDTAKAWAVSLTSARPD